jgi:hypothetical protein
MGTKKKTYVKDPPMLMRIARTRKINTHHPICLIAVYGWLNTTFLLYGVERCVSQRHASRMSLLWTIKRRKRTVYILVFDQPFFRQKVSADQRMLQELHVVLRSTTEAKENVAIAIDDAQSPNASTHRLSSIPEDKLHRVCLNASEYVFDFEHLRANMFQRNPRTVLNECQTFDNFVQDISLGDIQLNEMPGLQNPGQFRRQSIRLHSNLTRTMETHRGSNCTSLTTARASGLSEYRIEFGSS